MDQLEELKERKNFFFSRENPPSASAIVVSLKKNCEIVIYLYQDVLVERE